MNKKGYTKEEIEKMEDHTDYERLINITEEKIKQNAESIDSVFSINQPTAYRNFVQHLDQTLWCKCNPLHPQTAQSNNLRNRLCFP